MTRSYAVATLIGIRQYARHRLFVILLVGLPFAFITLSFYTSPDVPIPFTAPEGGLDRLYAVSMPEFHGAIMVPITVAFLGALGGLFLISDAKQADWRLPLAGMSPAAIVLARMTMLLLLVVVVTGLSVAVTALNFRPSSSPLFVLANLELALIYAGLGALVGVTTGRLGGTYIAFIVPMLDVGLIQNPMFPRERLAWWGQLLPGWAPTEVLIDVSFTASLDRSAELWVGLAYALLALALSAMALYRQVRQRA